MKTAASNRYLWAIALTVTAATASAEPWKFGVISDTQWKDSPDGLNPNTVAVNVIRHLDEQLIQAGAKFVVAVGDVTNDGSVLALDTRATFAQELYNAGVGFYPLRGNHESSATAAAEFRRVFPQTQNGINNLTPEDALITTAYYGAPAESTRAPFKVGKHFSSYPSTDGGYDGLFYAFDYHNARFVLIDQFTPALGSSHSNLDADQIDWIGSQLSSRAPHSHAFVFGHKGFITENHSDTLFGSNPSVAPELQNTLMAYLDGAGVRYYMGGHDHMHNRAVVVSPDGASSIQNIITASDSYKFYIPKIPSNDDRYDILDYGITNGPRETELAQELFAIGYYLVTVDGPRVTVDYFSTPNGCGGDCDLTNDTVPYSFERRETFGYSLNGREFLVEAGGSYTVIADSHDGTRVEILDGENQPNLADYAGRYLSHAVDTGWSPRECGSASATLVLWGMSTMGPEMGPDQTDPYVLSLSYDRDVNHRQLVRGQIGIETRDADGNWVLAASLTDSTPRFVFGPWQPTYELGTYGVDPRSGTAWAAIDYQGEFRVANLEPAQRDKCRHEARHPVRGHGVERRHHR